MRLERGFSRLRTKKNEGAQVKRREGVMLSEIGFIGGATIACASKCCMFSRTALEVDTYRDASNSCTSKKSSKNGPARGEGGVRTHAL
jgi:hypothetical protein